MAIGLSLIRYSPGPATDKRSLARYKEHEHPREDDGKWAIKSGTKTPIVIKHQTAIGHPDATKVKDKKKTDLEQEIEEDIEETMDDLKE
jgi:hypothetical protein